MEMRKRVDAWALIRYELTPSSIQDFSIKGIYDQEGDAYGALQVAQENNTECNYSVIHTRRFPAEVQAVNSGLPIIEPNWNVKTEGTAVPLPTLNDIREIAGTFSEIPETVSRRTLLPILGYVAENAVARALGATLSFNEGWDLNLPDGKKVEVKSVYQSSVRPRPPTVVLKGDLSFDVLVIVVFKPDLQFERSILIPNDVVRLLVQHNPGHGPDSRNAMRLKILPYMENWSGIKSLDLSNFL